MQEGESILLWIYLIATLKAYIYKLQAFTNVFAMTIITITTAITMIYMGLVIDKMVQKYFPSEIKENSLLLYCK